MRGLRDFLITNCKWLFNGALIWVTVLILTTFTLCFFYGFLRHRTEDVLFGEFNKAYGFHFIMVTYMTFLLLAFAALFMTYFVGPGYSKDHFESVKLEPLQLGSAMDINHSESSFRDSEDCRGQ